MDHNVTRGGRSERVENVLSEIRQRIENGKLAAGQSLPSERRLATEFGVSRSVVQGAVEELERLGLLDCRPNCRPKVRFREPNVMKARRGRDHVALWIHPNLEDMGAATILQGVQATLATAGYKPLIGCAPMASQSAPETTAASYLDSLIATPSVAGAIVWHNGEEHLEATYRRMSDAGLPIVFVDREPPEPIVADFVGSNNLRAARNAVRHLIGLGHKRIVMVANDEDASSVRDRIFGYRLALEEAGISYRPEYVFRPHHPLGETGLAIAAQILALSEVPTAVFAVNDQTALRLYDALTNQGRRIPEDFSLVGFDWYMRWLPSGGHITTVCQQFDEIGRIAAERVLARIGCAVDDTPCHFLLDAPLVVKGSTAPPRS